MIDLRIWTGGESCPSCETASTCRSCPGRPRLVGRRTGAHEVHVVEDYSVGHCHCGEIMLRKVDG